MGWPLLFLFPFYGWEKQKTERFYLDSLESGTARPGTQADGCQPLPISHPAPIITPPGSTPASTGQKLLWRNIKQGRGKIVFGTWGGVCNVYTKWSRNTSLGKWHSSRDQNHMGSKLPRCKQTCGWGERNGGQRGK